MSALRPNAAGLSGSIEGFVLAGGESSRFGSDKALALWRGRSLLEHALDAVRGCGLTPRVVCPDPAPYRDCSRAFVVAERTGRGPAEGIRAALHASAAPWALVLSTDMPRVDAALIRVLCAGMGSPGEGGRASGKAGVRAVCFVDAERRRQPFPGLYHRSLLEDLASIPEVVPVQRVLDLAAARVLPAVPARKGTAPFDVSQRLANVNRPEDLPDQG